jgi:hypothetical protein
LYPLLFSGTYRMPPKNGLLLSMVAANGFVAVLHGATNAFIHANRYGRDPATDLSTALLLALAPVPLLGYSWWLIGRFRQLRPRPLAR